MASSIKVKLGLTDPQWKVFQLLQKSASVTRDDIDGRSLRALSRLGLISEKGKNNIVLSAAGRKAVR